MKKLFGTDGIRGLANSYPMTSEMTLSLGQAIGYFLRNRPEIAAKSTLPVGLKPLGSNLPTRRIKVVIGKDTRLSGYMIENALASGLLSMGVDVYLIGPLSTPGVAFVTQSMRADAGVMISASHNSYQDNGIKLFSAQGYKFDDGVEKEIEDLVLSKKPSEHCPTEDLIGKAYRIDDAVGRYLVFLKSLFPNNLDLHGVRVALDCANGASYKVAPTVFEELGAEVIPVGIKPNGLNINKKCGALFPETVASTVVEYRADIGISLDGDGDRCILSDENGEIVDGDQIIGLCALQMAKQGKLKQNTVVTTPMSNLGLEQTLKENGIQMIRAQVGDRYIVESMRKNNYNLGGEQSGHMIFLDQATTGDGIVAALKVLEIMRTTKKKLSELKKEIKIFPQVCENVKVSKKTPFEQVDAVWSLIEKAKKELKDNGRVFVRYSGTEPLARVMLEGENHTVIEKWSKDIAQQISQDLG